MRLKITAAAVAGGMALSSAATAQGVAAGAGGGELGGAVYGGVHAGVGGGVAASGGVTGGASAADRQAGVTGPATTPSAAVHSGVETAGDAKVMGSPPVTSSSRNAASANAKPAPATDMGLSTLAAGMPVRSTDGRALGTVSRVDRGRDGMVSSVFVTPSGKGRKPVRYAPGSLSISGGTVISSGAR